MGNLCGGSGAGATDPEVTANRIANRNLLHDRMQDELRVKLLLLGAGESGKTTLFKQMRLNYGDGFESANEHARDQVFNCLYQEFGQLLKVAAEVQITPQDPIKAQQEELLFEDLASVFLTNQRATRFEVTEELAGQIKRCWKTGRVQHIWGNKSMYQVLESLDHLIINIDRLASPDYQPTKEDYLLSRVRTTGIIEQTFTYNRVQFLIVDVGGQRSERRKWIQCFDNVTAVIFVASVSEFDQKLYEDNKVDRMGEALNLFKNTLNFKVFRETPFILFLNKVDLFEEKMQKLRTNANWQQYFVEHHQINFEEAQDNPEKAILEHFKTEFEKKAEPGRVFTHFITAINTDTFKKVFEATAQIILSRTLNHHFHAGH